MIAAEAPGNGLHDRAALIARLGTVGSTNQKGLGVSIARK